jgi:autoinducer 2 (AI-2) kinase
MRNSRYILTIDVGTGSGKAILFDHEGRQLSEARREWLPDPVPSFPGARCFDTDKAWRLLAECVRETIGLSGIDPRRIEGVTATSMREGMVLYDRDKRVIWACPNVDARAAEEVREMVLEGLAEPVYRTGGDWLTITSPARFRWIRKNRPDIWDRIACMNMLSDWVLFRLSGNLVTEPSCGSSSGIFDLNTRSWSENLVGLLDLPRGIYPAVSESGTVIGRVSAEAALDTGLSPQTRVLTSGGDTQCALLGVGAVDAGALTVVGGTFWQTTLVTDKPLIDPRYRLRTLCHAVPGRWMVEGIGFYHGFTMRWFRDGFCLQEKEEARSRGMDAYALMEELAAGVPPGSGGVQAVFSDVMNARQWKHAVPALVGFDVTDPESTGKAACIRAIEESAAYTCRGHVDILGEIVGSGTGGPIAVNGSAGSAGGNRGPATFCGGSSRGSLWPRILADVLGVPLRIPVVKEATALGSAACACVALGWFRTIGEAASSLVRWESEVLPVREHVEIYDECYRLWRKVYQYLRSMADDGVLPSLWKAPSA